MGSSWRRSGFTCQPSRTADKRALGWGPQPEPERTIKTGARTLYRRGEPIGTSDWFQVCPKTFVSGMVDSDARVPGR
jgi:hypothetical protein